MRLLLEGLAFSHRSGIRDLEALTGARFKRLSLVGGGSRNALLCQMTADATGLDVVAGPAEATAIGNLALQAAATGGLSGPEAVRELVRRSFRLQTYRPRGADRWQEKAERFAEIVRNRVKDG